MIPCKQVFQMRSVYLQVVLVLVLSVRTRVCFEIDNMENIIPKAGLDKFESVWREQRRICKLHKTCETRDDDDEGGSHCCGHCDCDPSCVDHGTCCLGVYQNFTQGYNRVYTNP